MGASHYFMSQCVDYNFDTDKNLIDINYRNTCWMPEIFSFPEKLDGHSIHLVRFSYALITKFPLFIFIVPPEFLNKYDSNNENI